MNYLVTGKASRNNNYLSKTLYPELSKNALNLETNVEMIPLMEHLLGHGKDIVIVTPDCIYVKNNVGVCAFTHSNKDTGSTVLSFEITVLISCKDKGTTAEEKAAAYLKVLCESLEIRPITFVKETVHASKYIFINKALDSEIVSSISNYLDVKDNKAVTSIELENPPAEVKVDLTGVDVNQVQNQLIAKLDTLKDIVLKTEGVIDETAATNLFAGVQNLVNLITLHSVQAQINQKLNHLIEQTMKIDPLSDDNKSDNPQISGRKSYSQLIDCSIDIIGGALYSHDLDQRGDYRDRDRDNRDLANFRNRLDRRHERRRDRD